jgi:hypothetical protein
MIFIDPSIVCTKNKLDIFSELFYNFNFLSNALFRSNLDRQGCYNAFKGFMDIVRFNEAAGSENVDLKTRHETITRASEGEDARIKSLILEFLRWREANFSLSDSDACSRLIRNAYSVAFDILHALSECIVSEVSKLDRILRLFEVENLEGAAKENPLHPISIEPQWNIVSEEILQQCSLNLRGVWLSYFNLFVLTDNAIGSRLHEVVDLLAAIFRKHNLLFPEHYSFPAIITEDMFRALLYSCYVVNPYLYYDYLNSDMFYLCNNTMCKVMEPPHQLVFIMAREALIIQTKYIRQKDTVILNISRWYRNVLKLLRLKIFFCLGKILVPYENVFDYYVYAFPEDSNWMLSLKHSAEANRDFGGQKREDLLIHYYPKVRSLMDSMSWVFDSALIPERLHRDRP